MIRKVMLHLICHLDPWNKVVSFTVTLALCDANICAKGIAWPIKFYCTSFSLPELRNAIMLLTMSSASLDKKRHVASHFNHLDLTNVVMLLMIPLVWHHAGANGITWPKNDIFNFDHLDPTSGLFSLMTLLASYDIDTSINGITWPKMLCCTLLQWSLPNIFSDVIDNATGIMWFWYQYQQCHTAEKVMLHFFLIILN